MADADRERRQHRQEMRLDERLRIAIAEAAKLSTVPAAALEGKVSSGKAEDVDPPQAEGLDVSDHLRVIEARMRRIEEEVDAHKGLVPTRNYVTMIGAEKDKILFSGDFEGMHNRDVAEAAPYLGTERTVQRLRRERGLDAYGRPRKKNGGERAA